MKHTSCIKNVFLALGLITIANPARAAENLGHSGVLSGEQKALCGPKLMLARKNVDAVLRLCKIGSSRSKCPDKYMDYAFFVNERPGKLEARILVDRFRPELGTENFLMEALADVQSSEIKDIQKLCSDLEKKKPFLQRSQPQECIRAELQKTFDL